MRKTGFRKSLSLLLCMMLIAAMALFTTGCGGNKANTETQAQTVAQTETQAEVQTEGTGTSDAKVLGEGNSTFTFAVTDLDGAVTTYEIHTDETVVGTALVDLDLIAGEEAEYGLYVQTVDGITLDYDKDGKYWAFYVDGEYAAAGVDSTEIVDGSTYEFKAE